MARDKVTLEKLQESIRKKNHEKILEYKIPNESNLVGAFWKNPSLYNEHKINTKHFDDNKESNMWRVYFVIGKELVKEGKRSITEVEVDIYLDKHKKLRAVYEEAGGYQTVESLMEYIDTKNVEGYINEFNKWWALSMLNDKGWLKTQNIKEYMDYTLEDIYRIYQVEFNDIFINTVSSVKSHNLASGLDELINMADEGLIRGTPLYNAPMIDKMIGGWRKGEVVMLGGISGSGKSTTMIEWLLPTIFFEDDRILLLLNEQDENKIRREMITWIANNIFDGRFNKERWVQGGFTKEEKELLNKSADWLKSREDRKNVIIIPLQKYSVEIVIKLINKYAGMGIDRIVLDTFKADTDADTTQQWAKMTQDSVKLYDCIKPTANNVALWINLQLAKSVSKHRFLGLDSIGVAKNVVDVASTFIAMRPLWNAERQGGKKETHYIRYMGEEGGSTIKETVSSDNHINHTIFFVPKSREGSGNHQVIAENNLGRNTFKELGIMYIEEDF